ncbi:hypothetical protein [Secundilactobacillus silagei]|uniref:Uncharacterized protein n=1 Tax=Secundilactobacillus silagei JCM 19001 TaxID=1302250 RepID=A0A1Z5II98_9LACO|nr:hypothetical protein [Secundilactobacillus silagei]TDG73115.1 hypothetical protein C5L25_000756 [Secundilactobacillus silagei JCM 19001]GAX01480.1 hypothetical protein IWT126_01521 [Secundilactobacillus silagei JCM 19001]
MKLTKEQSKVMPAQQPDSFVDHYDNAQTILPAVADQLQRLTPQQGLTDWVLVESEADGQVIEIPLHTGISPIEASFRSGRETIWNLDLDQPGTVSRLQAEYEHGGDLVNVLLNRFAANDPINPCQWLICRSVADPEIVWLLEFFQNKKVRQQYLTEHLSRQLFDVLAKPPVRINIQVVLSGFAIA